MNFMESVSKLENRVTRSVCPENITGGKGCGGMTPLEEGKLMSAEECALHLAKALQKRRSQKILTFLGKATVWAHRLFPNLTDRLTYGYIAREADSPFK